MISNDSSVDVVVIGAGLSGLIAARTLKRQGKTVRVLEAKDHIGGRVEGWSINVWQVMALLT